MQYRRYVILAFVVAAILAAVATQAAVVSAIAQFGGTDARLLGLFDTSTAAALGGGLVTFVVLVRHPRTMPFAHEVVAEMAKVTWPDKDETLKASTTVVSTAIFVALLLGVYDLIWKNLADLYLFTSG